MPELPEVQTITDDLNKKIKGDVITDFWSDTPSAVKNTTIKKFKSEITGRKILGAHRIGKNMFIDLSGGKTIYIHLKMTGHLLVKSQISNLKSQKYFSDKVNQYIHHIWTLGKNKTLEFSDMRKFAKIVLLETNNIKNYKDIKIVGTDVFDKKFTFKKFDDILGKRKKAPIGIVLMDQNLMAGIGNIYRSEILYDAGIDPVKTVGDLGEGEKKKIYRSVFRVLKKAIKLRGTSDSDYRDTSGAPGSFQKALKVYRRERQKCPKCATIVKRIKLGGRSVFYCEKCQK
ncbi:MAG TPA: bifunctional DNA-formamidopyrimidine glycosylase/DNA-(apurinic or apyrimidinic site) lyase [Candidatus Moranbacteria bacterium]|nr:bifunctional DNA-formamidopyrimidine glycosylase/DNA-(apurinic or apyrimidinic site) lyase [Candidatus Moranbacteria bacterium]